MSLTIFGSTRPLSIRAQLVQSSSSTLDEASKLTTASWRGRLFALDDAISKKGSRGRSSWIRTQGIFIREIFTDQSQGMKATSVIRIRKLNLTL